MSATIKETVREIIAEQIDIELKMVECGTSVVELGADSLHCVEIVIALEEEFGIKIQERDSDRLMSVDHIITYLNSQGIN